MMVPRRIVWPDAALYVEPILEAIANLRNRYPGSKLNVGGDWCSPKCLFDDPTVREWVAPLAAWLGTELDVDPEKGITGWGLIVGRGAAIDKHKHEKSARWGTNRFAGTYCVTRPERTEGSSVLTAYEADGTPHTFEPEPGSAVVFDALTQHEATPHLELEPRVMVAFSVA